MIESYELEGPPELDSNIFLPVYGTQEAILKIHAEEREIGFPDLTFFDAMSFGMKIPFDDQFLIAHEVYETEVKPEPAVPNPVYIEVLLGDQVLYLADAGQLSPLNPLQGLWSYDGHWVMEYAHVTMTKGETENSVLTNATGHLVEDAALLNEIRGYDEIFGFQLLKGKPFYFFESGGQVGISYDGQVTMLAYEGIPHYGCCSAATINPRKAQNMVAFFAQKGDSWYYIEIGIYAR